MFQRQLNPFIAAQTLPGFRVPALRNRQRFRRGEKEPPHCRVERLIRGGVSPGREQHVVAERVVDRRTLECGEVEHHPAQLLQPAAGSRGKAVRSIRNLFPEPWETALRKQSPEQRKLPVVAQIEFRSCGRFQPGVDAGDQPAGEKIRIFRLRPARFGQQQKTDQTAAERKTFEPGTVPVIEHGLPGVSPELQLDRAGRDPVGEDYPALDRRTVRMETEEVRKLPVEPAQRLDCCCRRGVGPVRHDHDTVGGGDVGPELHCRKKQQPEKQEAENKHHSDLFFFIRGCKFKKNIIP